MTETGEAKAEDQIFSPRMRSDFAKVQEWKDEFMHETKLQNFVCLSFTPNVFDDAVKDVFIEYVWALWLCLKLFDD